MPDPFSSYPRQPTGPAQDAFVVAPSDTADLPAPTYGGFWIETKGTVKVTTSAGTTLTLPAATGYWNLVVKRIWSTGTTATGIVGLV